MLVEELMSGSPDLIGKPADDLLGNIVLDFEDILEYPVVNLRKYMEAVGGFNQLGGHPDLVAGLPHTALKYV